LNGGSGCVVNLSFQAVGVGGEIVSFILDVLSMVVGLNGEVGCLEVGGGVVWYVVIFSTNWDCGI